MRIYRMASQAPSLPEPPPLAIRDHAAALLELSRGRYSMILVAGPSTRNQTDVQLLAARADGIRSAPACIDGKITAALVETHPMI